MALNLVNGDRVTVSMERNDARPKVMISVPGQTFPLDPTTARDLRDALTIVLRTFDGEAQS